MVKSLRLKLIFTWFSQKNISLSYYTRHLFESALSLNFQILHLANLIGGALKTPIFEIRLREIL